MRIIFSILLILIINLGGLSQSTRFFKTYDYGSTAYPIFLHVNEFNNRFYTNGVHRNVPNEKIFITKSDNLGNIIDTALFGVDTGSYNVENFIFLNNSKLLLLTQFQRSVMSIKRQYMLYLDTNLVMYNDSLYPYKYSRFLGNCRINKSYYFTGPTWYNDIGDSLPQQNVVFWKTDTNFNTITTKSIGTVNGDAGNIIKAGFDNNLLLGGLTLYNGNQQVWYLVNTDTTGQVLGQYMYGVPHWNEDGLKTISLSSDSCYFLSGILYQYDFGIGHYYFASCIAKIDRQFNTIWVKNIGETIQNVTVSKMVSTYDGNQVVLTQRSPVIQDISIYSQVTKFNNDGNILWSRNYLRGDTSQYVRYRAWDIIETSDKGFAFCGSAIDTTNMGPNQEAWLVKTDSLGCDGLQSCNDTALVCEILNAPDTTCKNDTAWLQVRFKGRSAPYFVYANTALALDSVYYPYTLPLWIDTLVPYVPHDTDLQQVIVKVKDPWGWYNTDTIQIFVKNCGTGNIQETWYPKKVEIFPNPATTELHVKFRTPLTEPVTITINDMQGKQMKQITTKQNEAVIDVSGFEQGVYSVKVIGSNVNSSERFVKL